MMMTKKKCVEKIKEWFCKKIERHINKNKENSETNNDGKNNDLLNAVFFRKKIFCRKPFAVRFVEEKNHKPIYISSARRLWLMDTGNTSAKYGNWSGYEEDESLFFITWTLSQVAEGSYYFCSWTM